jgi:hypothetical protein
VVFQSGFSVVFRWFLVRPKTTLKSKVVFAIPGVRVICDCPNRNSVVPGVSTVLLLVQASSNSKYCSSLRQYRYIPLLRVATAVYTAAHGNTAELTAAPLQ